MLPHHWMVRILWKEAVQCPEHGAWCVVNTPTLLVGAAANRGGSAGNAHRRWLRGGEPVTLTLIISRCPPSARGVGAVIALA